MSRLTEHDVESLAERLREHDEELRRDCGADLAGIAANAAARGGGDPQGVRVGVVPITTGLGVIGGFAGAVCGILRHLGADAAVTAATDVGGVREALTGGCEIVFAADDDTFIAVNLSRRYCSDNSEATGRGFAAALDLAAGGVGGKDTLVLGAGPVGLSAAAVLAGRGARVHLHDIDAARMSAAGHSLPGLILEEELEAALAQCPYVLDATPAAEFLTYRHLRDDSVVSAPGVPLGIDRSSLPALEGRWIHDVLEIGVATMLYDVL